MLLVLTYHRIVENPGLISGFFDVSADELNQHLQAAKKIWGPSRVVSDVQQEGKPSPADRGGFLITFDDGTVDHYFTAAPVLERNGLRGVFFVSTALLGTPGYMTVAQCRELQDRGHAIESHSHEHKALVSLEPAELRAQLASSRQILRELGLGKGEFLAVPGGYFDKPVIEMAKTTGYLALRTIRWGYNRHLKPFQVESIIVNQKTAGSLLAFLLSPNFEIAKKLVYSTKELLKGSLPRLYWSVRHRTGRRP
jgi:peptidoglycan/xylan/chitin deacetylase (PgdA/CDA1 family)